MNNGTYKGVKYKTVFDVQTNKFKGYVYLDKGVEEIYGDNLIDILEKVYYTVKKETK